MIEPRRRRTIEEEFGYFNSEELRDPLLKQDIARAASGIASVAGAVAGLLTRALMRLPDLAGARRRRPPRTVRAG
jgi:hypothetical protein